MSALRSALVEVLRGLPDAELGRIVRAAPDDALRALVPVALELDADEGGETLAAPEPKSERKPRTAKPKAPKEAARGTRPTLVDALAKGPKTTTELAEALGISTSGVRQAARKLGRKVRPSGGKTTRGTETTWELA